MNLVLDQLIS